MSTTLTSTRLRSRQNTTLHGFPLVLRYLRFMFIGGPKVLLTSRISAKCAAIMTMMCAPSLLICSLLTIPEFIFQSPHQQAYFYFSKVLNEDPTRWIALLVAGACTLMSLAVPATMTEPSAPIRY